MYETIEDWLKHVPNYQAPDRVRQRLVATLQEREAPRATSLWQRILGSMRVLWLKPVFAVACLMVLGIFVTYFHFVYVPHYQARVYVKKSIAVVDNPAYFYNQVRLCSLEL